MKISGELREGVTATDLVLTLTQLLRQAGVVDKFVEFFGAGLASMSLPDRATIGNMAPEYGATCGFFPVDDETLSYLRRTGRSEEHVVRVERYCKEQRLFRTQELPEADYSERLELDLATVEPSLAGPRRPQDRVALTQMKTTFAAALREVYGKPEPTPAPAALEPVLAAPAEQAPAPAEPIATPEPAAGVEPAPAAPPVPALPARDGDVVIAAITSCTNTSNPSVMIAAGLVAKKAVERGLRVPGYVKTSLAPGSKVVSEYLQAGGLQPFLDELGFHLVGYGCTTCIGNSGPLPTAVAKAVQEKNLIAAAVLSGNRNFEGRVHPLTRANYLGLAAAGGGLCPGRHGGHRPLQRAGRPGPRRSTRLLARSVALTRRSGRGARPDSARYVRPDVCRRLRRQRGLEFHPGRRGRAVCLGAQVHLHPGAALLRGAEPQTGRAEADSGGTHPRPVR